MTDIKKLETMIQKHGFTDFKWIDPKEIVVADLVGPRIVLGSPGYPEEEGS